MDNYVSRADLTPVDRTAVRAPSPAAAAQPVNAMHTQDSLSQDRRNQGEQAKPDAAATQEMASVAEFVEVHARVSEILADLRSGSASIQAATSRIDEMIPRPIVLVPMPPASKEAVEHAAVLARRIVERAHTAHSAQANLSRATVEQIASDRA